MQRIILILSQIVNTVLFENEKRLAKWLNIGNKFAAFWPESPEFQGSLSCPIKINYSKFQNYEKIIRFSII